mmetsp:Transcript_18948/g.43180  ORF Transcript_18948/g.43180 Transcript_18948/m.43180 type:complete len:209 (-) Transcript_18948:551-1177(-)
MILHLLVHVPHAPHQPVAGPQREHPHHEEPGGPEGQQHRRDRRQQLHVEPVGVDQVVDGPEGPEHLRLELLHLHENETGRVSPEEVSDGARRQLRFVFAGGGGEGGGAGRGRQASLGSFGQPEVHEHVVQAELGVREDGSVEETRATVEDQVVYDIGGRSNEPAHGNAFGDFPGARRRGGYAVPVRGDGEVEGVGGREDDDVLRPPVF